MDIIMYPNAFWSVRGTHVSLFARLLRGKKDDQLNWPFIGEVTLRVLNQLEDGNHFKRALNITSDMNLTAGGDADARGYPEFIPHFRLSRSGNTQYLKDDTLYIRASI